MILPQTQAATLLVLLLALVCLGSWANTFKMASHRRYELYYVDWIVGAFAAAVLLALTLGTLGFDGFSFRDDLMIAARKAWLYAFVAGGIFSLGNLLLMAALSIAGLVIAFPIAAGISLMVGAMISFVLNHDRPVTFLILGSALLLAAAGTAAVAYRSMVFLRHEEVARAGKAKSTRRPGFAKPVILAAIGGVLLGSFTPLADKARAGEIGLGPYAFGFLFVFGAAASALLLDLFLMNLPVEGEPIEIPELVKGKITAHAYGLAGGATWCLGIVAAFVAAAAGIPPRAQAGPALNFGVVQSAALIAALWGIFGWKELRGSDGRLGVLAGMTLLLLAGGIAVLAVAPLFTGR